MNKKWILSIVSALVMISCAENKTEKEPAAVMHKADSMPASMEISLKDVVFDLQEDPTCGMPLTAGLSDTAHYKGKVYGFCAKECKDEFLKNPESYLAKK